MESGGEREIDSEWVSRAWEMCSVARNSEARCIEEARFTNQIATSKRQSQHNTKLLYKFRCFGNDWWYCEIWKEQRWLRQNSRLTAVCCVGWCSWRLLAGAAISVGTTIGRDERDERSLGRREVDDDMAVRYFRSEKTFFCCCCCCCCCWLICLHLSSRSLSFSHSLSLHNHPSSYIKRNPYVCECVTLYLCIQCTLVRLSPWHSKRMCIFRPSSSSSLEFICFSCHSVYLFRRENLMCSKQRKFNHL